MSTRIRKIIAMGIAIAGGVAIAMLTADTAKHWSGYRRCDYRFPWSGQCSGVAGHNGEHF